MPKKNAMPNYPAFPNRGVLTRDDDRQYAEAVQRADATPDNLVIHLKGRAAVNFPTKKITRDAKTDRLSFVSADTPYRIRELREDDGRWLSKYKTLLPLEALNAVVGSRTPGVDVEDLDSPDETLDAFSLDDSVYIVGVVYTNGTGRWTRIDGDWILMSPTDDTFEQAIVTPIDPERADEFLKQYDQNYITVTDAEQYEADEDDDTDE